MIQVACREIRQFSAWFVIYSCKCLFAIITALHQFFFYFYYPCKEINRLNEENSKLKDRLKTLEGKVGRHWFDSLK